MELEAFGVVMNRLLPSFCKGFLQDSLYVTVLYCTLVNLVNFHVNW